MEFWDGGNNSASTQLSCVWARGDILLGRGETGGNGLEAPLQTISDKIVRDCSCIKRRLTAKLDAKPDRDSRITLRRLDESKLRPAKAIKPQSSRRASATQAPPFTATTVD